MIKTDDTFLANLKNQLKEKFPNELTILNTKQRWDLKQGYYISKTPNLSFDFRHPTFWNYFHKSVKTR